MKKSINDNQVQVREVDVTVDGIPFVVYFMECDITNDCFKLHFYATDESVQKNFDSIFKKWTKMMRNRKEFVVELCIGDFKKNVIMSGSSSIVGLYEEEIAAELEDYEAIIHCTLKFNLNEDDCNYLIDKYYPERTRPSYESVIEKYGDLGRLLGDDPI